MIPTTQSLRVLLGQALDISVPVKDQSGEPVDLATADIDFAIYGAPRKPKLKDLATTVEGSTITASLSSSDSLELGVGRYYFALWVTISGEQTPVALGFIRILQSTRGT